MDTETLFHARRATLVLVFATILIQLRRVNQIRLEGETQAEVLRDLGCEMFQGYLFGKPAVLAGNSGSQGGSHVG
ncbi:MAG: hypothetical protein WD492_03860 [Alkalispirochaeta sp.]